MADFKGIYEKYASGPKIFAQYQFRNHVTPLIRWAPQAVGWGVVGVIGLAWVFPPSFIFKRIPGPVGEPYRKAEEAAK